MGARDNRVFRYAVLLSVLVHAIALLVSPSLRDAARRVVWPEPIVARLAEPERPAAPAPSEPRVPAPLVQPPPRPKPPPVAKAAPKPLPAPVEPAPQAVEPPPAPAAASPSSTPSPSAPAAAASAPPAPPAPIARPGAEIDADTVGRYRMLVIDEARKLKRYPRAARDNNWEGRARVRVSYGADGRRASVDVARSSGYEVLDREAVETITRAAEVPVPAALRGKAFAFEVEMEFNLNEK